VTRTASARARTRPRTGALVLVAALAGALPAGADVSSDVRTLAWRRPVHLPGGASGWYAIVEDSVLAAGSGPEFADLRLTNAEGRSLPVRVERPSATRLRWATFRDLPVRWTASGKDSREMIVDLGADAASRPVRLTVELTGLSARTPVQVTSRDSTDEEWVLLPVVHDPATPLDSPLPGTAHVEVGDPRRFLRLVQDRASAPGSEDRLRLLTRETSPATRESVAFRVSPGRFLSGGNEWQAVVTLDGPARAVTALTLRWAEERGARTWRVEARLPAGGWRFHAASRPDEDGTDGRATRDSVDLAPVRTTELRITVTGADAPNIPCEIADVKATPQRWLFRADAPESLWVAYGDPFLETPADAGEAPPREEPVREAALGAPEPNPFRRDPGLGVEWLKRHPSVVGVVMIGLLGLVTWLAVGRAARHSDA